VMSTWTDADPKASCEPLPPRDYPAWVVWLFPFLDPTPVADKPCVVVTRNADGPCVGGYREPEAG